MLILKFSLPRHYLGISSQLHGPTALTRGKVPKLPIGPEAERVPEAVDDVEKRTF
jgi:hypothetical protein